MLDNLFALSRITSGQSYYFGDTTDTYQIAQGICEYNQVQRVVIRLPAEVCDGTVRGVRVVCGGEEYTTQLMMPFESPQAGSAPEKKEYTDTEHTKPVPAQPMAASGVPIWMAASVGGGVILAVAAAGILLLFCRKRKKKAVQQEQKEEKKASEVVEIRDTGPAIRHWYDDLPRDEPDEYVDFAADTGENTVQVFGNASRRTKRLRLVNVKNESLFYEVTLQGCITVGRSASCQITIDNASVSRTQCEIYQQDGQIYAVNRSQTNPTRIGRTVMDHPIPLKNGTVLTMGRVQMRVEMDG